MAHAQPTAESAAASLLDAVASAACVDERCAALRALAAQCAEHGGPDDKTAEMHLAAALLRRGVVPQLLALTNIETCADGTRISGEHGVAQARSSDNLLVAVAALAALRELLQAATGHRCRYCNGGTAETASEAVADLLSCGGIAHVASLLQSRSHKLAYAAMQCASVLLDMVEYSPALEALVSSACLENALFFATSSGPLRFAEKPYGKCTMEPLQFVFDALQASDEAKLQLPLVPAALSLLLRFLEPRESVLAKNSFQAHPVSNNKEASGAPALRRLALNVLAHVLFTLRGQRKRLPSFFVQPLVLSLIHMTLADVHSEGGCVGRCVELLRDCAQLHIGLQQLAELVPITLLRALCELAESADGGEALGAVKAFSACPGSNAALLLALLSPSSRHLLGDGLPDAMTAAEITALENQQSNKARRAFRTNVAEARNTGYTVGAAAATPLLVAARAATTARARLSLSRAADYVRLCAMAPHVSVDVHCSHRTTVVVPDGLDIYTLRGVDVQQIAGEHAYAAVVSEGLEALTLGSSPDLCLLIDEPGLDPETATTMGRGMMMCTALVGLLRVARQYGFDDVGHGFDDLPLLSVFDAHGDFVPSAEELACLQQTFYGLPDVLPQFTLRFEHDADERFSDYECSLAATLETAPEEAAAELRDIMGFGTAAASGNAQLNLPHPCSKCPNCISRRALGRLCALPTCTQTLSRDGTALKLCSRCRRSGYCSKEVRARLHALATTTPDFSIAPTPSAAPSRGLGAPQEERVPPQEEGVALHSSCTSECGGFSR